MLQGFLNKIPKANWPSNKVDFIKEYGGVTDGFTEEETLLPVDEWLESANGTIAHIYHETDFRMRGLTAISDLKVGNNIDLNIGVENGYGHGVYFWTKVHQKLGENEFFIRIDLSTNRNRVLKSKFKTIRNGSIITSSGLDFQLRVSKLIKKHKIVHCDIIKIMKPSYQEWLEGKERLQAIKNKNGLV